MYYYKLEKDGVLHGFLSAIDTQSAPWVLISREEFIVCGGIDSEPDTDEITMTQLAVADLAQAMEEDKTATQLAIADVAEALLGGAT